MTATKASLLALALCSGCLRFGYNVDEHPGGASDAGTPDAAVSSNGGGGGAGAASNGGSPAAGRGGSPADDDAGVDSDVDRMVGDTGLRVNDILGFYSGPWGDMVLRAHDAEIWGVYKYDGGTIVGQITSDGVFTGWWTQLPTRTGLDSGVVEFRWKQVDGTTVHFDGRWHYANSKTWFTNWNLDLVTDRTPPTSLTDRFDDPSNFVRQP